MAKRITVSLSDEDEALLDDARGYNPAATYLVTVAMEEIRRRAEARRPMTEQEQAEEAARRC